MTAKAWSVGKTQVSYRGAGCPHFCLIVGVGQDRLGSEGRPFQGGPARETRVVTGVPVAGSKLRAEHQWDWRDKYSQRRDLCSVCLPVCLSVWGPVQRVLVSVSVCLSV